MISLGSNCSIAYHLDRYKLRTQAFPFDYCKTPIRKLVKVLNNNFEDFENVSIKKKSVNHKLIIDGEETKIDTFLVKNKYNIIFAHELSKDIEDFDTKILRRIDRFKKQKNPIFIRIETENLTNYNNLYHNLIDSLNNYFDEWKLILISKFTFSHDKIININFDDFSKDWKYSHLDWNDIFFNKI